MNDIIKITDKSNKCKSVIKIRDKKPVIKIREVPTFLQIITQKDKTMEQLATAVKGGIDFKIVENSMIKENFLWFVDYYIEHEFSKFTNKGIGDIVNNIILNMTYVLDYLRTYDSKLIDRDKFVELRWVYNRNCKFQDSYTSPKGRHIVIKDGSIIDRCNNVTNRPEYKKSQILIEYSKSLYKAISYKTYKKLNTISSLQVNMTSSHYMEDDDTYEGMYYNERTFTSVEQIIRYFCDEYGYVNAGASYYAFVENTMVEYIVECEYFIKGESTKHKCKVDDFLRDFLPDIN